MFANSAFNVFGTLRANLWLPFWKFSVITSFFSPLSCELKLNIYMVSKILVSIEDGRGIDDVTCDHFRPLHTALINEKYEVFQNLLDVMVTLPDAKRRINAYNYNHQVNKYSQTCVKRPYKTIHIFGFSGRWLSEHR